MNISEIKKKLFLKNDPVYKKDIDRFEIRSLDLKNESRIIESNGHKLISYKTRVTIDSTGLEKINIIDSNLSGIAITLSTISQVDFVDTKLSNSFIVGTDFIDCIFENVKFDNSIINRRKGKNFGSFKNCKFKKVKFDKSFFELPLISNCSFEDCTFDHTDFDGSRFENTTFKSEIKSTFFRGYSTLTSSSFIFFNPKKIKNEMKNVDFIQSELIDVTFTHGISLSQVKFPQDKYKYLYIANLPETYKLLREIINTEWEKENKEVGFTLIDKVYYNQFKKDQINDFLDIRTDYIKDQKQEKIVNIFFNLLKGIVSKLSFESRSN